MQVYGERVKYLLEPCYFSHLMVDGASHVDRVWREGLLVVAHAAVAEGTVHRLGPGARLEAVGGAHGGDALRGRVVRDIRGLVHEIFLINIVYLNCIIGNLLY